MENKEARDPKVSGQDSENKFSTHLTDLTKHTLMHLCMGLSFGNNMNIGHSLRMLRDEWGQGLGSCRMKEFARERREELAKRSGIPSQDGRVTSWRHEQLAVVAKAHQQLVERRASKTSEEKEPVFFGSHPKQQRKPNVTRLLV